ncbi:hypothetical protein R1flu_003181 [Riccia fluitans]|uniref:Uncharacterized protein n=1 Tax=Riccia fluitans TaxID=41844 RepID=A0ABD1Y8C0_9MARC
MAPDPKQTGPIKSSELESYPLEYLESNYQGRGEERVLGHLEPQGTLDSSDNGRNIVSIRPANSLDTSAVKNYLLGGSSAKDHSPGKECGADLICSEQLFPLNWKSLVHQSPAAETAAAIAEDELMIYNHHAQQWQDEPVLFNQFQERQEYAGKEEEGLRSGGSDIPHECEGHQEQQIVPVNFRTDERINGSSSKFFLEDLSDIDVITESFSFWPDETIFYSCPSSPSFFPVSPLEKRRQSFESFFTSETRSQTPYEKLEYPLEHDATTSAAGAGTDDERHGTEGIEFCNYEWSLGTWTHGDDSVVSAAFQHDGVLVNSRDDPTGNAGGKVQHDVDNRWADLQRVAACAHQEWMGLDRTCFALLEERHEQQQQHNEFGVLAVAPTQPLQEHTGNLLLLNNTKRDRTNSIEMLSKPTSALRKKKQKDAEIPEGRLRGTSICMDPNLQYGLPTLHSLLKDFHESAAFLLRPDVAALLDSELEILCIGDNLAPETRHAAFAALRCGHGNQSQEAAFDSELVEQILDLKMSLVTLLEESRFQELSFLSQLRDTISRYSFLFPASAGDAHLQILQQRLTQINCFKELEHVVCQYFRESKIFIRSSSYSASSSSGFMSVDCFKASGLELVPYYDEQAIANAQIAVESQGGEGTSIAPTAMAERNERFQITSRRELSGARGNLPRVAAEFMRSWLFDNFDNP